MRYIGLLAIFALPGCITAGPNYNPPNAAGVQEDFVATADDPFVETETAGPWWQIAFEDSRLTALVVAARDQNLDLAEAAARLRAADARLSAARRAFLPQGQTSASWIRNDTPFGAFGGGPGGAQGGQDGNTGGGAGNPAQGGGFVGGGGQAIDIYSVSADLSWEIDLFGRLRRQAQRARASRDGTAALFADTRRLITARMASAYLDWVEAARRQEVAARNLGTQTEALRLTEQLFDLGEIARFDVTRQRTQTALTRASVVELTAARAEALSAIALLSGLTVPDLLEAFPDLGPDAVAPTIPAMVPTLALSDPTTVLRRRPDVAQAERSLAAATYQVGIDAAALFPQVTLTGSASLQSLDPDTLFDTGESFGYSFGPRLTWNIFSYPQILAQVKASNAEAEAAVAAYRRTVIGALTETDAALVSYARSLDRAAILQDAFDNATESLALAEARYRAGADSLVIFLDSQRTALNTEDQFVAAQIAARRARVAVHRALAE